MQAKSKHSDETPIAWRTYLDGCGLITFIFVAFWGVLVVGIIFAVQFGIETFIAMGLIIAIVGELLRQEQHRHPSNRQ